MCMCVCGTGARAGMRIGECVYTQLCFLSDTYSFSEENWLTPECVDISKVSRSILSCCDLKLTLNTSHTITKPHFLFFLHHSQSLSSLSTSLFKMRTISIQFNSRRCCACVSVNSGARLNPNPDLSLAECFLCLNQTRPQP